MMAPDSSADCEECARCGIVGPVDVACRGCANTNDRDDAVRALLDALAMPSGRSVRDAWDRACLLYGRSGDSISDEALSSYLEDTDPLRRRFPGLGHALDRISNADLHVLRAYIEVGAGMVIEMIDGRLRLHRLIRAALSQRR